MGIVWVEWVVHPQIIFVKWIFKQILFHMGTLRRHVESLFQLMDILEPRYAL